MKTKSILITAILLICSMVASAQTSVTKAIERYYVANGQLSSMTKNMRNVLITLPEMINLNIPSGYTAESLADKYLNEQYIQDLAVICSPSVIEQGVTAAEINELSDLLESPEGKLATEHGQIMNNEEHLADMMAIVQKDMVDIILTGKYTKSKSKASDERCALFNSYYQICGIENMLSNIIKAQMNGQVSNELIAKVDDYFRDNMPILLLNLSEGVLTDDDLRFFKMMCDKPQYTKMINGITKAPEDVQQLGLHLITKYSNWVESLENK